MPFFKPMLSIATLILAGVTACTGQVTGGTDALTPADAQNLPDRSDPADVLADAWLPDAGISDTGMPDATVVEPDGSA
ncbi:MAG: hypothetical protein WC889_16915, partial [Myxococcota bacterium]